MREIEMRGTVNRTVFVPTNQPLTSIRSRTTTGITRVIKGVGINTPTGWYVPATSFVSGSQSGLY